ncbi:MAG: ABC transporter permease, partial [Acidobacteriota bacterium]
MRTTSSDLIERLLALVSQLVPRALRTEWLREWTAEFRGGGRTGWRFACARLSGAVEDATRLRSRTLWRDVMITQDIKQALKRWRREPLFALVVVAILALGLGANTAVFALIDATMLRPLPFRDGDELVHFWQVDSENDSLTNFSHPTFVDIGARARTLAGVAAYHSPSMTWSRGDDARTVEAVRVSPNFFTLLGVEPVLGRNFRAGDDQADAERVVILSDGFWRTDLGADPAAIGTALVLDDTPYTVIGVLSQDFVFPRERRAEVWRPLIPSEREATARGSRWMHIIGRLAEGTRIEQAQAEMEGIAADLAREDPDANGGYGLRLVAMREQVLGDTGAALAAVYGAVLLVLMITCANLAHLILARVTARRGEIAVRDALGATRWQLARHVLVEVVLLFTVGGLAGALFASWLLRAVVALMPADAMLQAPYLGELGMSAAVLGYGLGLALACGLLFGLIPALRVATAQDRNAAMSGRTAAPRA